MRKRAYLFIVVCILIPISGYAQDDATSFIFAGHIRGPRNFTINSLLPYFAEDASVVDKDLLIVGGDTICGYVTAYDEEALNNEWDLVDRYLDQIGVPVYRVAGNHDMHSSLTQKVFNQRYGPEYYSFIKNDIMFIALNTTKIYSDSTLDWEGLWARSELPFQSAMPDAEQNRFFLDTLAEARDNENVANIVIFMSSLLWGMPDTKDEWWKNMHPLLVSCGKVRLVLSGEAGNNSSDTCLEKDGIKYLRSGWGITEDEAFSLRGTYLQVIFEKGNSSPEIYTRFIGLTPEYYQALSGAINGDTQKHLKEKLASYRGDRSSVLSRVRMNIRDCLDRNIKLYDRGNNISWAVILAGAAVILLAHIIISILRRKR